MNDVEIYNLGKEPTIVKKVEIEMLKAAKYMAIDGGGSPTANQKAFALQAFLNPGGYVEPFINGCVLDALVQTKGTAVDDAVIASLVAALWPILWA